MRAIPLLWLVSLALAPAADPAKPAVASETRFIDNGRLKIGVDLTSGGSVFWFSELPADRNLLNHADRGRFIQQSYYGKPDGSVWAKKPWRWNPVQGGDYKHKPARVVECKAGADHLYVRSVPVNWAGGQDLEDCRMEQWISFDKDLAKIRYRFVYRGKDIHPAVHQELPAVFMDHDLADLVYEDKPGPPGSGVIRKDRPGWPNEGRKTGANWAGFVGADGRGAGVFFPGTDRITTYRHPGPPGPKGGGCSYFAPIRTMAIKPDMDFGYEIYLTIGSAVDMRDRFSRVAGAAGAKPTDGKKAAVP